jgi:plasmid stability protein
MSDVLIRDLPDGVLARLDERARQLGLSRTEFLRRMLTREASREEGAVTVADLSRFADAFTDLADPSVMDRAWR